ncbi:hypothetical protein B0H17DRAFT_1219978 [Mycena rosella]|uniref:Uncharacterized protein n=1 Tax=Mycena rosella TaxID=1033263 RepID=A0AAD7BE16_MYCRO|nr:hypothetical protein B0H17DRAFT_1219978 [Mycena rosella]
MEYRLKVYTVGEDASVLTTLEFARQIFFSILILVQLIPCSLDPATFIKIKLATIRDRIGDLVDTPYQFCDEEGGVFKDQQTLGLYFKAQDVEIVLDTTLSVHLKTSAGISVSLARILKNPPFLLKFVQKLADDGVQQGKSVHSSKFNGAAAGRLPMSDIRKLASMSSDPKIHKFCLEDGHAVEDSITLEDYVSMLTTESPLVRGNGTPSIEIFFTKHDTFKRSKWHESDVSAPEIADKFEYKERLDVERPSAPETLESKLEATYSPTGSADVKSAGMLSETEWANVIRNCNLMYGWTVDITNNQVRRAPKPAFQLRPGLNLVLGPDELTVEEEPELTVLPVFAARNQLERPGGITRPGSASRAITLAPNPTPAAAAAAASTTTVGPEVRGKVTASAVENSGSDTESESEQSAGSAEESDGESDASDSDAEGNESAEATESDGDASSGSAASGSGDESGEDASSAEESDGEAESDADEDVDVTDDKETSSLRREQSDLRRQNALLKQTLTTLHAILDSSHVPEHGAFDEGCGCSYSQCPHKHHAARSSGGDRSGLKVSVAKVTNAMTSDDEASVEQDQSDREESVSSEAESGETEEESEEESAGSEAEDGQISDAETEEGESEDESVASSEPETGAVVPQPSSHPLASKSRSGASRTLPGSSPSASEDSEEELDTDSQTVVVPSGEGVDGSETVDGDRGDEDTESEEVVDGSSVIPLARTALGIPNFAVDDRSKVEVVSVEHEFEMSMAVNHFSTSSVSGSISGGYAGFSAEVSGSYGTDESRQDTHGTSTKQSTMIATYRFPRATIHLTPEDLVPTEDLQAALTRVNQTKDINDLRKLHENFGHLFCKQVMIGGALQSTKVVSTTSTSQETTVKEAFRASVGVAVKTPAGVGASLKAEHEQGKGESSGQKDSNISESVVFEATGGTVI